MASCCRKARFCRASSRWAFRLDLAVASRAYSKSIIGVGELAPKRGNVNDCSLDGVLRRDRFLEVGKGAGINQVVAVAAAPQVRLDSSTGGRRACR